VAEAQVLARPADALDPERFYAAEADGGEGRFTLHDVAAGEYDLEASAPAQGHATSSGVRVSAGRPTDVGSLVLARGGIVRGAVVDTEGRGIPGAAVTADRDVSRATNDYASQTDSAGSFEIRGVPAGRLLVRASHPSFAPGRPVEAEVDPEKELVPVRLVLPKGGRVEGRVRHRDGRPFGDGLVQVMSAESASGGAHLPPVAPGPDGGFVFEHLPLGRADVYVMAYAPPRPGRAPGAIELSGIARRQVDVSDGETEALDIDLRDVIVFGRVTSAGQPAPAVRVSAQVGPRLMSYGGQSLPVPPAPSGPPPLAATTREDGSYELTVFEPGQGRVGLRATLTGQEYPWREVSVPDLDRYELDLELPGAVVSGIVVDAESGEGLRDSRVGLQSTAAAAGRRSPPSSTSSGPDGRFSLAADPGEYRIDATLAGRPSVEQAISVGPSGLTDVRLALARGGAIVGVVQDAAGRPLSDVELSAHPVDESTAYAQEVWAESRPGGAFRLEGLRPEPYVVVAGSSVAGYVVRSGVKPGAEPLTLTLQRGRIALRVLGEDGQPVPGASATVVGVDGVQAFLPGNPIPVTDPGGATELAAPPGRVEVLVQFVGQVARGTVNVRPDETVALTVTLRPAPPRSTH